MKKIAIIYLGYGGLPLGAEFGKYRPVLGFDINQLEDLRACQIYIVTASTPVGQANRTDMTPLAKASETVGKVLKAGDIVKSKGIFKQLVEQSDHFRAMASNH